MNTVTQPNTIIELGSPNIIVRTTIIVGFNLQLNKLDQILEMTDVRF